MTSSAFGTRKHTLRIASQLSLNYRRTRLDALLEMEQNVIGLLDAHGQRAMPALCVVGGHQHTRPRQRITHALPY